MSPWVCICIWELLLVRNNLVLLLTVYEMWLIGLQRGTCEMERSLGVSFLREWWLVLRFAFPSNTYLSTPYVSALASDFVFGHLDAELWSIWLTEESITTHVSRHRLELVLILFVLIEQTFIHFCECLVAVYVFIVRIVTLAFFLEFLHLIYSTGVLTR